jgi:hypothetical protein
VALFTQLYGLQTSIDGEQSYGPLGAKPQERCHMHIQDALSSVKNQDSLSENSTIPQLVGQIYESAPVDEKIHLLEHLMRPLGVTRVLPEDAYTTVGGEVAAVVDFVQKFSVQTVYGLAHIVTASPALAGSALAALLVTAVLRRAQRQNLP